MLKIPEAEYHAIDAISASMLKRALKSLAHVDVPVNESSSMRVGRAVHAKVLEGIEPLVIPDRRTKDGKEAYEKLSSEDAARAVNAGERDTVNNICAAISAHSACSVLLSDAIHREVSFVLGNKKCRIDAMCDEYIIDIKTTSDSSPSEFRRQLDRMHYDLQAAWYVDLLREHDGRERDFYFIAVENDAPYNVVVYKVSKQTLAIGRDKYNKALDVLKRNYRGYVEETTILEI